MGEGLVFVDHMNICAISFAYQHVMITLKQGFTLNIIYKVGRPQLYVIFWPLVTVEAYPRCE